MAAKARESDDYKDLLYKLMPKKRRRRNGTGKFIEGRVGSARVAGDIPADDGKRSPCSEPL
jgi:hypothetical protein